MPGKVSRTIPIFPELRPHLEAAFDQAAEGSVYVITSYRRVLMRIFALN